MNDEKTGGPAYPEGESYVTTSLDGSKTTNQKGPLRRGKTLLDDFAGLAMQGILAAGRVGTPEEIARVSHSIAAAMIAERTRLMNEKP